MTTMTLDPPLPPRRRAVLARRVRWLVAATITYNVAEAVVAIIAGSVASSGALVAFGLDSVIEVASAAAVAWQFSARTPDRIERRERRALRIIAVSFFALAGYVAVDAVRTLTGSGEAGHSTAGLVLAALSLAIMPGLSYAQRRTGRELGSASAVADSKQTLLCTNLSAVLLAGLTVNSLFGWAWADPIAALVIAAAAVREGRQSWRGDTCCAHPAPVGPTSKSTTGDTAANSHGCASCDSGRTGTDVANDLGTGVATGTGVQAYRRHMDLQQVPAGQNDHGWAPQACTLPTSEQPLRVAEFDALFAEAVTAVQPDGPGRVRLELRPDPQVAGRAAELAARETGCCSFFTFVLTATGGALTLQAGVEERHTEVLDALVARATRMSAAPSSAPETRP
ncbi:cation transporter [Actinomadura madurae]|uniref:cation transporter n=1 Tax=Actinomadura madurae TaxID=1993 RepID=UPI0035563C62